MERSNQSIPDEVLKDIKREFARLFPKHKEFADSLEELAPIVGRFQPVQDEETRKLGADFLSESARDITSVRLLYSAQVYPHAVYHLQQAIEKAAKGYSLALGFLTPQEVFTHDTPELFLEAFIRKTGLRKYAALFGKQQLKQIIDNAYESLSDAQKQQEIALSESKVIIGHLRQIEDFDAAGQSMMEVLRMALERYFASTSRQLPETPLSLRAMHQMIVLFVLAAISFPHEAYTRYPDREIKPSDYGDNLGIVETTLKIVEMLESELGKLKALLGG